MCFDKDVSILAWSVSYAISFYLLKRNRNFDRWNAFFIMSFATIQLIEAGMWQSIEDNSQGLNQLFTKLALLTLSVQPLVQSAGALSHSGNPIMQMFVVLFSGLLLWSLYRVVAKGDGFHTDVGPNRHFVWKDSNRPGVFMGSRLSGILYMSGLFVPLMYMGAKGLPLMFIGLMTAAWSYYKYRGLEFGSMWCFTAISYSVTSLFL